MHSMYIVISIGVFAILCAGFGYVVFHNQDHADSGYKFVVASLFSAPLLLSLFIWCSVLIANLMKLDTSTLGFFILAFFIYGNIAVLSIVGWAYYALTALFVMLAWLTKSKPRSHYVALGLYTFVLILYIGYNFWWHATGQQMTFP